MATVAKPNTGIGLTQKKKQKKKESTHQGLAAATELAEGVAGGIDAQVEQLVLTVDHLRDGQRFDLWTVGGWAGLG